MGASSLPGPAPADRQLLITRTFDAPRRRVFAAWTTPEHLGRWWGPRFFTLPVCEMAFCPGGAYRHCLRSPEGRDHGARGAYGEIVEPERIVFTTILDDEPDHEILTTVTFAEREGRTRLTVHQSFADTVMTRGAQEGWTQSLARLAEHLRVPEASDLVLPERRSGP